MPPAAPAISATEVSAPIVPFARWNSSRIGMTAKLKRRKSMASSIQPSCAAKSARHARRSTSKMDDMSAEFSVAPTALRPHTREKERLDPKVGRNPAALPLDLEVCQRRQRAEEARLGLVPRRFPLLVQRERMRLLAHEAVRFERFAETIGERVFEPVVIHRRFEIDALRSGEGDDADHLADLVSQREEE